jgi:uncharacterized membrane protein YhaH (DUF805 family)
MDPVQAIRSVLGQYATFNGRASRSEFWWWVGAWILFALLSGMLMAIDLTLGSIVYYGVGLLVLIPYLAVLVRRLHDTGRSGWWFWIVLIPIVGAIVLLIFLVLDSEPGVNRWGPPPPGSRYYAAGVAGWSGQPATAPGEWGGASSFGTGGAVGSANVRTKIFTGTTTEQAEAAFRADLPAANAAGYQAVGQRWDTTQPQPTLVVDYEPMQGQR